MVYFTPPGRDEHRGNHPLFGRLLFTQGVSLLKEDGFYRQVENPTDEEVAAAEKVYFGGREHDLTFEESVSLTDAGYGNWILTGPYGDGVYGAGAYGGAA